MIPKQLNDEPAFNEDGSPQIDANGEPVLTTGLKTQWIVEQKQIAGTLLAPTDWYVVRKAETDAAIPAEVLLYREQVRSVCGEREAEIAACTTNEQLKELLFGDQKLLVVEEDPDTGEFIHSQVANPNIATAWPEQLQG